MSLEALQCAYLCCCVLENKSSIKKQASIGVYVISDINTCKNPPSPLQSIVTVLVCIFEKAFVYVNPRDISLSYSFIPIASKCNRSEKL